MTHSEFKRRQISLLIPHVGSLKLYECDSFANVDVWLQGERGYSTTWKCNETCSKLTAGTNVLVQMLQGHSLWCTPPYGERSEYCWDPGFPGILSERCASLLLTWPVTCVDHSCLLGNNQTRVRWRRQGNLRNFRNPNDIKRFKAPQITWWYLSIRKVELDWFLFTKKNQELISETRKGPAFHYYYINIIVIIWRHPQTQAKPECRVKRCPFSTNFFYARSPRKHAQLWNRLDFQSLFLDTVINVNLYFTTCERVECPDDRICMSPFSLYDLTFTQWGLNGLGEAWESRILYQSQQVTNQSS